MSQILITGGTGLVGSQLATKFDDVVVTSRNAAKAKTKLGHVASRIVEWDYMTGPPDLSGLNLKAVVNLMGESVAKGRWTNEKKARLVASRVEATNQLVRALESFDSPPDVMVSASAVGYYGDHGSEVIDEQQTAGKGFLSGLAEQWEHAAYQVERLGIRLVIVRIGVVLASQGGALAEMLPIFKSGVGGRLGSGKQFFPWIHIDDLVKLIVWAINNDTVSGVFNATALNLLPIPNSLKHWPLPSGDRPSFLSPSSRFNSRLENLPVRCLILRKSYPARP